jgi:Zn-dependent alcohol dehydrogenase
MPHERECNGPPFLFCSAGPLVGCCNWLGIQVPFPRPAVLGHEVAGEVVAHGPGSPAAQLDALPVGTKAVGAFIMPCMDCFFCSGGQEEMCEKFFAFNRLNGTLYDGTTRLYSADRGDPIAMYRCVA